MADAIKIDLDMSAVVAAFDAVPQNIQRKVTKQALSQAGEIFKAELEAAIDATDKGTADEDPEGNSLPQGFMRNDVVFNIKGGELWVGFSPVSAHVARWQDKGWTLTSHNGTQIKDIPPRDFSGKAFDAGAHLALDVVIHSLRTTKLLDMNGSESGGDKEE